MKMRDGDVKETINQRQGRFSKQLTRERLVHSTDTSLDKNNYQPTTSLNGKGEFEMFGYLGSKRNKNSKII